MASQKYKASSTGVSTSAAGTGSNTVSTTQTQQTVQTIDYTNDISVHRSKQIKTGIINDFPTEGQSRQFFYRKSSQSVVEGLLRASKNDDLLDQIVAMREFLLDSLCDEGGNPVYTHQTIGGLPQDILSLFMNAINQDTTEAIEESKND
jgi:hypothetical protein